MTTTLTTTKFAPAAWLLVCDDEPDQVCYSEREMRKERKELEAMGFEVRAYGCISGAAAEDLGDNIKYGDKGRAYYVKQARLAGEVQ